MRGNFSGIPYDFALLSSLPYFLMGVIFGQLYKRWKIPNNLSNRIYVLSLLLILFLYPIIFAHFTGHYHKIWRDVGILFIVSFVFFLITFLVPDDEKIISNPIGAFFGKISYSIYLLHMPILMQIEEHAIKSPELLLPIYLLLTIVASYISYLVIESPSRTTIRAIASNIYAASIGQGKTSFSDLAQSKESARR
jgi:peptidoglycan/LPS O-acetylase OafA/YrhL